MPTPSQRHRQFIQERGNPLLPAQHRQFPSTRFARATTIPTTSCGLPYPTSLLLKESPAVSPSKKIPGKKRNVGVPKFLRFLYDILEKEDSSIIGWSHKGTAFQIRKPSALASIILPRYFKHNKVTSFQRQLNYFGFKKWTKTQASTCTFSHPSFIKGYPEKIQFIKRKERMTSLLSETPQVIKPEAKDTGPTLDTSTSFPSADEIVNDLGMSSLDDWDNNSLFPYSFSLKDPALQASPIGSSSISSEADVWVKPENVSADLSLNSEALWTSDYTLDNISLSNEDIMLSDFNHVEKEFQDLMTHLEPMAEPTL